MTNKTSKHTLAKFLALQLKWDVGAPKLIYTQYINPPECPIGRLVRKLG